MRFVGPVAAMQRARILEAAVEVVGERGFEGATVALVLARAKVSRQTFYQQFNGLQACFLAVIDEETQRAMDLVTQAFARESSWRDGLRAGVASTLMFLDSEPALARVWLVEVLAAGRWALQRRERNLAKLVSLIVSAWALPDGWRPPPLAAEGVMASVLGLLHAHIVSGSEEPAIALLGPLMGIIMRPYLSTREVSQEIELARELAAQIRGGQRPWALRVTPRPCLTIPAMVANPGAHRARACLLYLAKHPGANNQQIATAIGVSHRGQASTLLRRLGALDLLSKRAGGPGRPNAWALTESGARAAASLSQQCAP